MIRPFTKLLSKAKAAKLVRGLVDMYLDMDATTGYEVELCKECIQWATEEKRQFLRQALEARLIALYYDKEFIHSLNWRKKTCHLHYKMIFANFYINK